MGRTLGGSPRDLSKVPARVLTSCSSRCGEGWGESTKSAAATAFVGERIGFTKDAHLNECDLTGLSVSAYSTVRKSTSEAFLNNAYL